MPDLYESKAGLMLDFDPIALQGYFVRILYYNERLYRQVDFKETIPPFQCVDLGALAAGATSAKTAMTNLDLPIDEFGQFRFSCLDNAQLRLYEPAGVLKHQLKFIQSNWSGSNPLLTNNATEMCIWQDNRPSVDAVNGSGYALGGVRIIARGYRYHTKPVDIETVKRIEAGALPVVDAWCSGKSA
jgi:hypothetical protein